MCVSENWAGRLRALPRPMRTMTEAISIRWRSPEELVEIGFSRSRLVMMNEPHSGWLRCARTRRMGTRVLPGPTPPGVRQLTMEALFDPKLVEAANDSRHLPVPGPSYLPPVRDASAHPDLARSRLDVGRVLDDAQ
jgi:hypothetical protein